MHMAHPARPRVQRTQPRLAKEKAEKEKYLLKMEHRAETQMTQMVGHVISAPI